jgi:hypothetical protein
MFAANGNKRIKYFIISILIIVLSQCICRTGEEISKEGIDSENSVEILFGGDVMLDWGIKNIIDKYGYGYPLRGLKKFLSTFDYRFCNLEGPISDEGDPHTTKKYIFLTLISFRSWLMARSMACHLPIIMQMTLVILPC